MANWYGIKGIDFVWHGEWSDPEIRYLGVLINAPTVEDSMWYMFKESTRREDMDAFAKYMRDNAYQVKEFCRLAMEPIAYLNLMGNRGYGILAIDDWGESVIVGSNSDFGWTDIHEHLIYRNKKGEPYFVKHGKRYYINEFCRYE